MSNTEIKAEVRPMQFYAIDRVVQGDLPKPTEKPSSNKKYMNWGDKNTFPDYLLSLYDGVTTLRAIVDGARDYVVGDDVMTALLGNKMNRTGETVRDLVYKAAFDWFLFHDFAFQIIRNNAGKVAEVYHMPINYLRASKDRERFYYSEEWGNSRVNATEYPRFVPSFTEYPSSVYMVTADHLHTYPQPMFLGSLDACEIEREIDKFHYNALRNGFEASAIVHLRAAFMSDDEKSETEKNLIEKFGGSANAGRIAIITSQGMEDQVMIEKFDPADFGERYATLAKRSQQQIYSAFHCNPNLFGVPTENLGFSKEEYDQSFALYNRTQIQPVQAKIADAFDFIFGTKGAVVFTPFNIEQTKNIVK